MTESFDLIVLYKGLQLLLPAELLTSGYTHKIKVTIEGIDVFFEPDEEKNYRALSDYTDRDKTARLNKDLLQAISETLHTLFC